MISNTLQDTNCQYCGSEKKPHDIVIQGEVIKTIYLYDCDCFEKEQKRLEAIKEEEARKIAEFRNRVFKRFDLKSNYKQAGFTRKLRGKRLKKLTCEFVKEANIFINNFKPKQSKGLFLIGTAGNGKTTLAKCIGKELFSKGYKIKTLNFTEYMNKLQLTYSSFNNLSFDGLLNEWTSECDLLIIDDFGREKYTEKRLENAFLFFDKIYNECTSYIITANPENITKLKDIPEFFALFDRLAETSTKLIFKKSSFRR